MTDETQHWCPECSRPTNVETNDDDHPVSGSFCLVCRSETVVPEVVEAIRADERRKTLEAAADMARAIYILPGVADWLRALAQGGDD
jgi:hypothetical protein